jgi:hypothetical protein
VGADAVGRSGVDVQDCCARSHRADPLPDDVVERSRVIGITGWESTYQRAGQNRGLVGGDHRQ